MREYYRRMRFLGILMLIFLLIITLRMGHWTLLRWGHYQKEAENNYLHPRRLAPPRGRIFTRDGRTLAVNRRTYSIWISPFGVTREELHRTVLYLEDTLHRDFSTAERAALALRPAWKSELLERNLSLERAAPILERQWDLPGLRIVPDLKRFYLSGEESGHVIGYLGRISRTRMSHYLSLDYSRDDLVGISGLEYSCEEYLRGVPGTEVVQRDARGRFIRVLETEPAISGDDIYVTLDVDFQSQAWLSILGRSGVIIVMNPRRGDILAMVSYPGYDSSDPAAASRPTHPISYLNKATQENFPPGSPFKVISALAFLEAGGAAGSSVNCPGQYYLPGWDKPFRCNVSGGHGSVNLKDALKYSCNVYFYQNIQKCRSEAFMDLAHEWGFGRPTGIDLPFEVKGSLPMREADSLWTGSVLHLSIGQGQIAATPLQVLCAFAAFANGGRAVQPRLVCYRRTPDEERIEHPPQFHDIPLSPRHRNAILEGLIAVANEPGGTAAAAQFSKEWKVAGKTGTAERSGREDDAWFVGFAPWNDPEVVVLVMLEGAGHGGREAGPLAREMFDYYFKNRARLTVDR